jgi:hypothetical protein
VPAFLITGKRRSSSLVGTELAMDVDLVLPAMGFPGPVQHGPARIVRCPTGCSRRAGRMRRGHTLAVWAIHGSPQGSAWRGREPGAVGWAGRLYRGLAGTAKRKSFENSMPLLHCSGISIHVWPCGGTTGIGLGAFFGNNCGPYLSRIANRKEFQSA